MNAAVDNDVVLKGACYGLLTDLMDAIPAASNTIGVLGAARFVVEDAARRLPLKGSLAVIQERLATFFAAVKVIEPSLDEERLAAELEYQAQKELVALDPGESQLCAIVIQRAVPVMLTGDKRAITSLERLLDLDGRLEVLKGRLLCLEQLVARLLHRRREEDLRSAVCAEPAVDKALAICFGCSSATVPSGSCAEGLSSYIGSLRVSASRVLGPD